MKKYKCYVFYDADCSGYYTNLGPYTKVRDAEIFAKEVIRRKGGQCKILNNPAIHLELGHVGALELWTDERGEYQGYRKPFDPKVHEYFKYSKFKDEANYDHAGSD
jgi:hypothetical protein